MKSQFNYYENEIKALKKSNRYRERKISKPSMIDLASNDYLGLAHNKFLSILAAESMFKLDAHGPKASMLVNGYSQVHADFEEALCLANGFDAGVLSGSGFNANIAMIEALVRKGDAIFLDERYHASGVLAARLLSGKVFYFKHNDVEDLKRLYKESSAKRKIVAIEGIYSMDGDLAPKEIFDFCDEVGALLIVDEAHSSGVIGNKLMGVFDYYNIEIKPNHIKMGTLGKAYGSFGGYILASEHIIDYLLNRAKPLIYATAPSLFDTLLAHESLKYIWNHSAILKEQIQARQKVVFESLGIKVEGLIVPILIDDNKKVLEIRARLDKVGFEVGAIRPPTVERAIIRLIARLGVSSSKLKEACELIKLG